MSCVIALDTQATKFERKGKDSLPYLSFKPSVVSHWFKLKFFKEPVFKLHNPHSHSWKVSFCELSSFD